MLMDAPPPRGCEAVRAIAHHLGQWGFRAARILPPRKRVPADRGFRRRDVTPARSLRGRLFRSTPSRSTRWSRCIALRGRACESRPTRRRHARGEGATLRRLVPAVPSRGRRWPPTSRADYVARWRLVLPFAPGARGADDVLVLRDYHVDNLMLTAGARWRCPRAACWISRTRLIGPTAYDLGLLCLLQDARRARARQSRRLCRGLVKSCPCAASANLTGRLSLVVRTVSAVVMMLSIVATASTGYFAGSGFRREHHGVGSRPRRRWRRPKLRRASGAGFRSSIAASASR